MIKYLEKTGEINFDKIFNQRLGYLLFKDFCLNVVLEQVKELLLWARIFILLYVLLGHPVQIL